MTEEELNERVELLEKKKGSFTRNRNICVLATAFLAYNFYTTIKNEPPPVWFVIVMSAIIIACGAMGYYGYKNIKKIDAELADLYKEQQVYIEAANEEE